MSYTPGPWRADISRRIGNDAGGFSIDADGFVICGRMGVPTRAQESEANARLIAAAPEMLAALKAIDETCPTDPDVTPAFQIAWDRLEAAIAKAEGAA